MKIQKKSNKIIIASAIAVAVLFSAGAYAYATNSFPFQKEEVNTEVDEPKENEVDYTTPSNGQKSAGDDAKQNFIDKSYGDGSEAPSAATQIGITSISGDSSSIVSVRAMIEAPTSTGMCKLSAVGPGDTVMLTTDLQTMGSNSVCKGFDINLTKGQWTITVTYEDESGNSSQSQKDYEVK
jgi:hypothetical protein